jgi:Bacterial EndoU nuclease
MKFRAEESLDILYAFFDDEEKPKSYILGSFLADARNSPQIFIDMLEQGETCKDSTDMKVTSMTGNRTHLDIYPNRAVIEYLNPPEGEEEAHIIEVSLPELKQLIIDWKNAVEKWRIEKQKNKPTEFKSSENSVEVRTISREPNQRRSTFFPKSYTKVDVVRAMLEAYENRKQIGPNLFLGKSGGGLDIEFPMGSDGNMTTAYPLYIPDEPSTLLVSRNAQPRFRVSKIQDIPYAFFDKEKDPNDYILTYFLSNARSGVQTYISMVEQGENSKDNRAIKVTGLNHNSTDIDIYSDHAVITYLYPPDENDDMPIVEIPLVELKQILLDWQSVVDQWIIERRENNPPSS